MNGCISVFEFTTSEACKNHKKINEIPCLIIDKNRKLRDFTQLVKVKGIYVIFCKIISHWHSFVWNEIKKLVKLAVQTFHTLTLFLVLNSYKIHKNSCINLFESFTPLRNCCQDIELLTII